MNDVGPGDWVRCIDASSKGVDRDTGLTEGEVYQIAAVYRGREPLVAGTPSTGTSYDLEGVPVPIDPFTGGEIAYGAYRFVPLGFEPQVVARRETVDA